MMSHNVPDVFFTLTKKKKDGTVIVTQKGKFGNLSDEEKKTMSQKFLMELEKRKSKKLKYYDEATGKWEGTVESPITLEDADDKEEQK